jgi:aryl-phospho-beta-D-glucosidase BglC (GH1 family)
VSRWGPAAAAAALLLAAGCATGGSGSTGASSAPLPPLPPPFHPAAAAGATKPWVTTAGGKFVDQHGRPVILRGFDVSVGQSDLAPIAAQMGANLVRIYVGWNAIQPRPPVHGHYRWDAKVLGQLDKEVAAYRRVHVNVLIDFHQFHWSPYFAQATCKAGKSVCRASGVPAWFYAGGRYEATKRGEAEAQAAFWTSESSRSQGYYAAFAAMIAARYAPDPNVVGYEIFNEPHPGRLGDTTDATDTMLRWQAGIRAAIQKVDPARTVFIMCRGGGEGVGTASLAPFGSLDHLALDWHDYFNGGSGGFDAAGDNWVPSWRDTHNQASPSYTGTERSQARVLRVPLARTRALGIPLLVGEWGVHTGAPGSAAYQTQMLDLFGKEGVSWTRWVLSTGGGFGLLNKDLSPTPEATQLTSALQQTATS